jgi:hypothetical protein
MINPAAERVFGFALEVFRWRTAGEKGAAKLLGIPPSTLQSKLKAFNTNRPH